MRNFILTFITITMISCSSDSEIQDSESEIEMSNEELLADNSPWTYSHYEVIDVIDSRGSELTKIEIENIQNEQNIGWNVNFDSNGNGYSNSPNNVRNEWTWKINSSENLIFMHPNDTTIFDNWKVTSSELFIAFESITFDENITQEILHSGKNVFK